MMEFPNNSFKFHERENIVLSTPVESWPHPKNHQYYTFCIANVKESEMSTAIRAIDVVRQRPDIDCVETNLAVLAENAVLWKKMEELFRTKKGSFWVAFSSHEDISKAELQRCLSILQNVPCLYPKIVYDPKFTWNPSAILVKLLGCLPQFNRLECIDVSSYGFLADQVSALMSYPFARQLCGIWLIYNTRLSDLFSSKVITERLNTVTVYGSNLSAGSSIEEVESTLAAWPPCLKHLHVVLPSWIGSNLILVVYTTLFNWLQSPQCPITHLHLEQGLGVLVRLALAAIPNIPLLRNLYLRLNDQEHHVDSFLTAFSKSPHLEAVTWQCHPGCSNARTIYNFQLASRPRLFTMHLIDGKKVEESKSAQEVHRISVVSDTMQRFRRVKDQASFPLAAWALVLAKMNGALDSFWTDVHEFVFDAQFSVLLELLDQPCRLVAGETIDPADVGDSNSSTTEMVDKLQQSSMPPIRSPTEDSIPKRRKKG